MSNEINISESFTTFPLGTSTPYGGLDWTITGCSNIISKFPGSLTDYALKLITPFQQWFGAIYQDYNETGGYTEVSGRFNLLNNEVVSLVARVGAFNPNGSSPNTGYSLSYTSSGSNIYTLRLQKGANNTDIVNIPYTVQNTNDFTMKLICDNNEISGYVNDTLVIGPIIDSDYIGGYCGIRGRSGTIYFTEFNIIGNVPVIGANFPEVVEPIIDEPNIKNIADYVSIKLNGTPAKEQNVRPSKLDLYSEINKVHTQICNERDWLFLRGVVKVPGFSTNPNNTTNQNNGTAVYASSNPNFSSAGIAYKIAQQMTVDSTAFVPQSATIGLSIGFGLGAPSGSAKVYLLSSNPTDLAKGPDFNNNLLATSGMFDLGTLPAVASITTPHPITFNFPTLPIAFFQEGTKYWVVLELNLAVDNGITLYTATVNSSIPVPLDTLYFNNQNNTWTTQSASPMYWSLNGLTATYINEDVPVPNYVQHIYRMYSADEIASPINMLPYGTERFIDNPAQLPLDRFVLQRVQGGKQVVLYTKPSVNVPFWNVEFKTKATKMIKDTDIPLIPSEYVWAIADKVLVNYWGLGFGQQDGAGTQVMISDIADMLKSMRREYLSHPTKGFRLNRGGGVSMLPLPLDLPNRTFMLTNVPTYYRSTTSGS